MELLIKKAQNGDKEAFISIINEYIQMMYKVAKTRLSSEEDIGDAIQETILSAYKSICVLKNTSYFKTWLIKILINKCNDIISKNKKVIYVEDYYESIKNEDLLDGKESIEENIVFNETLNSIDESYKTVIVLYYVSGFNTREISEILKEKEGTIKSRLSRARQKLKEIYLKSYNEENRSFKVGGSK
ncbi:MAG: RNA polymerase sigma factor [Clostridium sp.]|uniref:RNA polymerase sigma factor n=1 Tax=Clostridium sp. TaxID=1506 RepID=UPI002910E856|nr:RNA polymerase sigma factor [Clostridium sp.]MDU5110739.1 RNA polymerase sigma factor [Clostridium sp.]